MSLEPHTTANKRSHIGWSIAIGAIGVVVAWAAAVVLIPLTLLILNGYSGREAQPILLTVASGWLAFNAIMHLLAQRYVARKEPASRARFTRIMFFGILGAIIGGGPPLALLLL